MTEPELPADLSRDRIKERIANASDRNAERQKIWDELDAWEYPSQEVKERKRRHAMANRAIEYIHHAETELSHINDNTTIDDQSWSRIIVGNLKLLSDAIDDFATQIAIRSILDEVMSRRAAADKLKVHPHTINRRMDNMLHNTADLDLSNVQDDD